MNIGCKKNDEYVAGEDHMYPAATAERSEQIIQDYHTSDPEHKDHPQKNTVARAPIGVFDSGAGGLTILSDLRKELPAEHFIYFGDTANCPYGIRSEEEIIAFSLRSCQFLIDQGIKLLVVACNTASQAALNVLRAAYDLPIVGVVPAVKPAARITRNGRIGIAATNQAVQSQYLQHLIENFASDVQVYTAGCSELVLLVEHGRLDGPGVEETLHDVFQPLTEKGVDVIVLGCTHFPALRPAIERVVGKDVQVIDSGAAIARRTHTILEAERILHPVVEQEQGTINIWCSGDAQDFSLIASAVLGYTVKASHALL
jgi:glutamate racemase